MCLQLLICYLWIRSKVGKIYVQTKTYSKKDNHDDWVWWMIQFFESQVLRVSERLYFFPEISNRWRVYLDTLLPHRRHFTVFGACNKKLFLPALFLRLAERSCSQSTVTRWATTFLLLLQLHIIYICCFLMMIIMMKKKKNKIKKNKI